MVSDKNIFFKTSIECKDTFPAILKQSKYSEVQTNYIIIE